MIAHRVRITYPGTGNGPRVVDVDRGVELQNRLPITEARAFIGVKPGETVQVDAFRLNSIGQRYLEGREWARERLELEVVEVVRPVLRPVAVEPSCGCQLCPRHQALQPRYGS